MSASYTTVSLMLMTIPVVSSRTNATSAELDQFASRGESLINARIGARYALPLTQRVPVLETIATDLAVYFFLSRRVFTQEKRNDSMWVDRYKESMEFLDKIADGDMALTAADGGLIAARTDIHEMWSNTKDYHPTMTEDLTELQIQDKDKIDDLRDARDQSVGQ